MSKENEIFKVGINEYKEEIQNKYVDFYLKDLGFLSTYEITLNSVLGSEFEKDILALKRMLYDVFNYDYEE